MPQRFNSEKIKMGPEIITESVERNPDWPWRMVQIYNVYPNGVIYEPFEDFPELLNLEVHKDKYEKAKELSIKFYNLGPNPKKEIASPIIKEILSICEPDDSKRSNHEFWERVAIQLPGDIGGSKKEDFAKLITQRSSGNVLEAMAGFNTYVLNSPNISNVVALDYSKEMLLRYPNPERKRILFDLNKIHSEKIKMDFFKKGEFDTITCCYGVNYLEKPTPVFREFHRILSSGGKLLVFGSPGSGYSDVQERLFNPKKHRKQMELTGFSSSLERFVDKEFPSIVGAHYLITGIKN